MHVLAYDFKTEADGRRLSRRTVSVIIEGFLIIALLLCAGCGDSDDANSSANKASSPVATTAEVLGPSKGLIKADPNPVPAGPGLGKVKISWNTGSDVLPVAITVSSKAEPEVNFSGGDKAGATEAPWIQSGVEYDFRLYVGAGANKKLIDHVVVTRNK